MTDDTAHTPERGNPAANVLRTVVAVGLLGAQALLFLFVLEIPYWFADRFGKRRGDAFYRGQRRLARWFFRLYPFGRQRRFNIRKGTFPRPCVIVCNRQSPADLLLLLQLPVNARWMLNEAAFKIPLMGELNKLARHIRIGEGDNAGFDTALDWLNRGVSVIAFPEGEPGPDGELQSFRDDAFKLAVEAGVPVVPVVLDGTGACLRPGSFLVRPPKLSLTALEPLQMEDAGDLKTRIRQRMSTALDELRRKRQAVPFVNGWLTRLGMAGVALVLALAVSVSVYVRNWCIAEPPVYDGDRRLAESELVERTAGGDRLTILGDNWRRDRDGLHEFGLTGDAWQRGYANARLSRDLVTRQEDLLVETAESFFTNPLSLWVAKQALTINNRSLPDYVSEREKLEVLGLTEGSVNRFPDEAPLYHRILNYHAAHDISHVFIDNPLVATPEFVGCSAFAAWGDATADGDLIVARNFDFEAGDVFDKDKAVLYVWPDEGFPYVHVAWAGMAGAVTGMNAEGLSIHINAARTSEVGFGRMGTPVSMLVRRVLEQCATIDEAFALIRETQVFVSDTYMVASRRDGRAVVIEKSPEYCAMREPDRDGLILQTNHMLTQPLVDDRVNVEAMETATTLYRWERLAELTDEHRGAIVRDTAVSILRNRNGRGGRDIGYGNRNAIAAGICAHSVVMNVTTGEMWVSTAPHTFGRYGYVNARGALEAGSRGAMRMKRRREMDVPRAEDFHKADDLREFRRQVRFARGAIEDGDVEGARPRVRSLRNLNPQSFETSYWQGRLYWLEGDYRRARDSFAEALGRDPHYEDVRDQIREWLSRSAAKLD